MVPDPDLHYSFWANCLDIVTLLNVLIKASFDVMQFTWLNSRKRELEKIIIEYTYYFTFVLATEYSNVFHTYVLCLFL